MPALTAWIPLVSIVMSMTATIVIVYIVARARQRKAELQAEVQTRLIDRFGSAPELVAFLQSPSGRQFVHGVQSAPSRYTRERVVGAVARAIVVTMLGVAFMAMWLVFSEFFAIPALLLTCLGVGLLAAAAVSYSLSAKLGVGDPPPAPHAEVPAPTATPEAR